ncbi:MAG: hypothetical protein RL662_1866 [Bacteroidota bacterium]|jgi:hypothetical protein
MIIPLNKGDQCPVCFMKIIKPNCWVRYHISYEPQMQILACKYCNYTEYCLRTSTKGSKAMSKKRVERVIKYQNRLNNIKI